MRWQVPESKEKRANNLKTVGGRTYELKDGKWSLRSTKTPSAGKVVAEVAQGAGKMAMTPVGNAINYAVDAVAHGPVDWLAKGGKKLEKGIEHIKKHPIKIRGNK